ncbi:hypothetical protein EVAR_83247_1 [Eumeta japonica]|uniref:Uncharacterized protein n=1 Tax=Eumeta variegata TaxID=151549 RepID=A0A4C1Y5U9_EUMVA|nr:hypothetical protein EVAR_83247_1 [Eumeta japonica]
MPTIACTTLDLRCQTNSSPRLLPEDQSTRWENTTTPSSSLPLTNLPSLAALGSTNDTNCLRYTTKGPEDAEVVSRTRHFEVVMMDKIKFRFVFKCPFDCVELARIYDAHVALTRQAA